MIEKLKQFKQDLLEAIATFQKFEKNVTPPYLKAITDLEAIIDKAKSASSLQQQIFQYVENDLPNKLFYFMPFVNDLKKYIVAVMNKPCYRIAALLSQECASLYEENQELRKENLAWQQKLSETLQTEYKNTQEYLEKLKQMIAMLQQELETAHQQAEQVEKIYQAKLQILRDKVTEFEKVTLTQQETISLINQEKKTLYANLMTKSEEAEKYKRLYEELREQIKKPSESNSNDYKKSYSYSS